MTRLSITDAEPGRSADYSLDRDSFMGLYAPLLEDPAAAWAVYEAEREAAEDADPYDEDEDSEWEAILEAALDGMDGEAAEAFFVRVIDHFAKEVEEAVGMLAMIASRQPALVPQLEEARARIQVEVEAWFSKWAAYAPVDG